MTLHGKSFWMDIHRKDDKGDEVVNQKHIKNSGHSQVANSKIILFTMPKILIIGTSVSGNM